MQEYGLSGVRRFFFSLSLCCSAGGALNCASVSAICLWDDLGQVTLASTACLHFHVYRLRMHITASIREEVEPLRSRDQTHSMQAVP